MRNGKKVRIGKRVIKMKVDIQYFWREKEYVRPLTLDHAWLECRVVRFKDGGM